MSNFLFHKLQQTTSERQARRKKISIGIFKTVENSVITIFLNRDWLKGNSMETVDWKPVRRLWELCSLLTHLPTGLKSTGTTGISFRASLKQKNCEERLTPSIQRTRMLTGCLGQSEHLSEFTGDVDAGPAAVVFRVSRQPIAIQHHQTWVEANK